MQNKRGQGLSTNAIILIILGVIVLVVLILGFTMGWDTIAPWIKKGNNVDGISRQCSVACTTQNSYDFCSKERTLKAPDLPEENGEEIKEKKGTCSFFATEDDYSPYGIEDCSGLCD